MGFVFADAVCGGCVARLQVEVNFGSTMEFWCFPRSLDLATICPLVPPEGQDNPASPSASPPGGVPAVQSTNECQEYAQGAHVFREVELPTQPSHRVHAVVRPVHPMAYFEVTGIGAWCDTATAIGFARRRGADATDATDAVDSADGDTHALMDIARGVLYIGSVEEQLGVSLHPAAAAPPSATSNRSDLSAMVVGCGIALDAHAGTGKYPHTMGYCNDAAEWCVNSEVRKRSALEVEIEDVDGR